MDQYLSRRHWTKRGFCAPIYASITQEIDWQIAQLRKRGLTPCIVRLGPTASLIYAWEQWTRDARIEDAPRAHKGYRCSVPIRYRDPKISGVYVEPMPASGTARPGTPAAPGPDAPAPSAPD